MKMYELVEWFQKEYPELVLDMRNCQHHLTKDDILDLKLSGKEIGFDLKTRLNPFHIEGDVFCHTMMVCKQAESAPYEVQIAALLHDIGKPSTRSVNPKNGRVSFYNHDAVSAFMSLEIMERLGLSDTKKWLIFNMIALHTQVFKQTPEQLSKTFTNEQYMAHLFLQLGKADSDGRFYSGDTETCMEEFKVDRKESVQKNKEVVVLCGLPGAGKSTWAKERINKEGFKYISRDYFIENLHHNLSYKEAWEKCDQKWVDKKLNESFQKAKGCEKVIVDMTHMSKKSRRRSLSHFGPEYKKTCVVFLPTMEKLHLQNEQRSGKVIDRKVIGKMMRSFYPPTYEEFDEIIWRF